MLGGEEAKRTFRSPSSTGYPELKEYARANIYPDCRGDGALYLATRMCRTLRLKPRELVLDLLRQRRGIVEHWQELEGAHAPYLNLVLYQHEHNLDAFHVESSLRQIE